MFPITIVSVAIVKSLSITVYGAISDDIPFGIRCPLNQLSYRMVSTKTYDPPLVSFTHFKCPMRHS